LKEEGPEFAMPPFIPRHGGNGSRKQQRRGSGTLLIPKPEVKEEQDDEAAGKAALLAEYEWQQRLITSSDDPKDCPGLRAAFLASLNDKEAWRVTSTRRSPRLSAIQGNRSWTSSTTARLDQAVR
jgi:hypothetical protein